MSTAPSLGKATLSPGLLLLGDLTQVTGGWGQYLIHAEGLKQRGPEAKHISSSLKTQDTRISIQVKMP